MNMTEPPSLKLNMLHQNQAAQPESQFFKLLWFHSQFSYKKTKLIYWFHLNIHFIHETWNLIGPWYLSPYLDNFLKS